MSGFDRQFPQNLEQPHIAENTQIPNLDVQDLLHEMPSLQAPPNTAEVHLPGLDIGDLQIDEEFPANSTEDLNAEQPKANWTIAVDLTTNELVKPDGTAFYYSPKEEELQQLLDLSKGNPEVAIVVQAEQTLSPGPGMEQTEDETLNRYLIRDGKISNYESVDSEGISEDHTDLLQFATEVAPSEHIGLIIQSHGGGGEGLVGDTGSESMEELTDAIKAGLEGSGHDRLDLLNFDSCSMASTAVIGTVSEVADHVVANELRGRLGDTFASQNVRAIVSNILQNPQATPEEMSEIQIENANAGAEPEVLEGDPFKHVGADVLTSFDTREYGQFSAALNDFGLELSNTAQDEDSRNTIKNLIDSTTPLPGGGKFPDRRDLKEFVTLVKSAAESGELPDENGAISLAATNVIEAQQNMIGDQFVNNTGGFEDLGGMYVFLPVEEIRQGLTDDPNGINWLNKFSSADKNFSEKAKVVGTLDIVSDILIDRLPEDSKKQFTPVLGAIDEIRNSQDNTTFQEALTGLKKTVKGLLDTKVEDDLRNNHIQYEDIPMSDHWNEFLLSFIG